MMTIVTDKPSYEARGRTSAARRKSDSEIELARLRRHHFQRSLSIPVLSASVIPVVSQNEADQFTGINEVFTEKENCSMKIKSSPCTVIDKTVESVYLKFHFRSQCNYRSNTLSKICIYIKNDSTVETSISKSFSPSTNTKAALSTIFISILILHSSYTGHFLKMEMNSLPYVNDNTFRHKRRIHCKTMYQVNKARMKKCKSDHLDKCLPDSGKQSLHSFIYTLFGPLMPCHRDIIISPVNGSGLESFFQSFENGMSLEDGMNFEWVRLRSFASFRCIANISPIVLSRSGFFYSGRNSEVKCFSCGATYNLWCPNDSILDIHRRISPNCRHLNGSDERNVPVQHRTVLRPNESQNSSFSTSVRSSIRSTPNDNSLQSSVHSIPIQTTTTNHIQNRNVQLSAEPREITGMSTNWTRFGIGNNVAQNYTRTTENNLSTARPTSTGSRPNMSSNARPLISASTANSSDSSSVSNATVNKLSPLGVNFDKPRYPQYAVMTVRMSTYNGWPATQIPKKMAEAGFIYAGYADYTRCFFCGGGLRNWEKEDDPWIEHARWFPRCAYVRQNKGEHFIQLVHERLQEMISGNMAPAARDVELQNQTHVSKQHGMNGHISASSSTNEGHPHINHVDIKSMPSYQSVLELGYASGMIENVIQQLLREGKGEITSNDILEIIFEMEDGSSNTLETKPAKQIQSHNEIFHGTETSQIVEENRRLKEQRLCIICEQVDSCIAFLPCGHLVCCEECAPAMRKCPKCQQIVQGSIKTWLV